MTSTQPPTNNPTKTTTSSKSYKSHRPTPRPSFDLVVLAAVVPQQTANVTRISIHSNIMLHRLFHSRNDKIHPSTLTLLLMLCMKQETLPSPTTTTTTTTTTSLTMTINKKTPHQNRENSGNPFLGKTSGKDRENPLKKI